MKEYWIETEPLHFCAIYDMHISIGINRHGTARIGGYIEDAWEEDYAKKLGSELWMTIMARDNAGEKEVVFCGIAAAFAFTVRGGQKALELELKSGTCLMDRIKHTRFFQNASMTYEDILGQLEGRAKGQRLGKGGEIDVPICGLAVQHGETDWEFMIRLLGNCHSFLVPEVRKNGIYYTIGLPERKKREAEEGKFFYEKNLEEFRKKKSEGMEYIRERDCIIYHAEMRELCSLGDVFSVMGLTMYIYEIDMEYKNGEMVNKCKAKTLNGLRGNRKLPENIKGESFSATVSEVKGDRVRISIKGDEYDGKCEKKWFLFSTPYSSSDGSGWYCMPEEGDCVRLQFPNYIEEDAYVVSAVHLPAESGERSNPDYKIMKNKQQKEIRFTPDSILLTNNKGMKIEMVDGKGILIESDKSILIKAGGDLNVVSDTASLMLAAETSLVLSQSGTSIQLEDGIRFMGGEFHVQ